MNKGVMAFAVLVALNLACVSPAWAGWRWVSLHPAGTNYDQSLATSVGGGQIGGQVQDNGVFRASIWNSPSSAGLVELEPSLTVPSRVNGVGGGIQVGWIISVPSWWQGVPGVSKTVVNPGDPVDWLGGTLYGVCGQWVVGNAIPAAGGADPMLYHLNATSSEPGIDLLPDGKRAGSAFGVVKATATSPGIQFGSAADVNVETAALWRGSAASYVDLHPIDTTWTDSLAISAWGDQQAGHVEDKSLNRHAALWTGTAASFVDLHPYDPALEQYDSWVKGMTEGVEVGYLMSPNGLDIFAGLWQGNAASFLNLDTYLPSGYSAGQPFGADWLNNNELWVVGAVYNDTLDRFEAAAWVYTVESPPITIAKAGTNVVISWPAAAVGFDLETKSNLSPQTAWIPVDTSKATNELSVAVPAGMRRLTLPIVKTGSQFYRLHRINTVTDLDGNVYKIVKIGTQEWLVGNLKTTRFCNGDAIPQIIDPVQWKDNRDAACCDYNNDPALGAIYGKLYNWQAASDPRGLAPAGWRVAGTNDWETLCNYLGGSAVAGGKLKEAGFAHWVSPNTDAGNETGFTALPGGNRGYNGPFGLLGTFGQWWTGDGADEFSAFTVGMFNDSAMLGTTVDRKAKGFSVRCVR